MIKNLHKGYFENAFAFASASKGPTGILFRYNFLTVTQSYNSKNIPISRYYDVKIAKSVFVYVLTMAFPTSSLTQKLWQCKLEGNEWILPRVGVNIERVGYKQG